MGEKSLSEKKEISIHVNECPQFLTKGHIVTSGVKYIKKTKKQQMDSNVGKHPTFYFLLNSY